MIMTLYYRRYSACNTRSVSVGMVIEHIQKQEIQTIRAYADIKEQKENISNGEISPLDIFLLGWL